MRKRKACKWIGAVILSVLALSTSYAANAENDKFWANRNSPDGALANYENAKSMFLKETNYVNAWKYARSAYFYGDNYGKDAAARKGLFTEGKKIAEIATNLGYEKPEGHYYLSVCIGLWAEANGVVNSLFAAPDILKEATKSAEIDPKYEDAGALMLRARVYQRAPGGISVGDVKKSQADYEKAIDLAPNNRVAHRFYAELLIALGNKDRAKEVIAKGIAIPFDETDKLREAKETGLLKELQKKI